MIEAKLGEFAALATALCWTVTAMSFESAGKKVGSLAVNWIRLLIGMILLSLFTWLVRGVVLPTDASGDAWLWLSISGLVGFLVGDLCLFRAFVVIGSRVSMLIMASVPPMTALAGWLMLGENLGLIEVFGMILTVTGIVLVVTDRNKNGINKTRKYPLRGVLLALGGAVGQALGLVLSKLGMGAYDAFAATQIRLIAGIIGFSILFFPLKVWPRVLAAMKNKPAMGRIFLGSVFGPFLGVSLSLLAVQHTQAGNASTIMSIVPVLIIPPAVLIFKEKVTFKEIAGAVIAVTGVAILFL